MLAAVGLVLAIAQPGDLGGEEETAGPSREVTTTTASTTTITSTTSTTLAPTTTTGLEPAGDDGGVTTTTVGGSGLGESTPPTGGTDGIAETGGESMIGAGMVLAALGLALRRAALRAA